MRITAAVLRAPNAPHSIEELELADPGPGQVRVRIAGAGLCHSDLLARVPGYTPHPIVTGHESSGIIDALGPGVANLAVGDPVVLSYDACRTCQNCLSAQPAYCAEFTRRNLTGAGADEDGVLSDAAGAPVASRWFGQSSLASHAVTAAANLVKVDRNLPLELLGPLGCGAQTGAGAVWNSLAVQPGSSIAVFGSGSVGLSAVMAARVAGAGVIVAVDVNPARRALALELGATHALDGAEPDLSRALADVSSGGMQYTLDTTGLPAVIITAVYALRTTGVCGLLGVQHGDLALPPDALAPGRTVMGIIEGGAVPQTFVPRLLTLWRQGRFPFDRLITTFPLARISDAERAALDGTVVKPVLLP
ncbi:NAD(P)-dependent alcohol dehydrogenase [Streptomyces sp. A1499]|uniref:NAD(P)-dependent alcohol dehydrogenase n=1 Tax=Streptomyces sp. A1499 TaxID=2563104 RepID=UPI00109EAECA|nr:NAD(P)-dependent alcohol dehydrogenase [Streptomyces sp. A1499]THC43102.1 NAD(P)-dependent alcohol dehydrogenase [Streptomyces sp. A1499]